VVIVLACAARDSTKRWRLVPYSSGENCTTIISAGNEDSAEGCVGSDRVAVIIVVDVS
jgi:hypothetical protein